MKSLKLLPILLLSLFSLNVIGDSIANSNTISTNKTPNGTYLDELKYLRSRYNKLVDEFGLKDIEVMNILDPIGTKINCLMVKFLGGKGTAYSELTWIDNQLQEAYKSIVEIQNRPFQEEADKQELNSKIESKLENLRDNYNKDQSIYNYLNKIWNYSWNSYDRCCCEYNYSVESLQNILEALYQIEDKLQAIQEYRTNVYNTLTEEEKAQNYNPDDPILLNDGLRDKEGKYWWAHTLEFYTNLSGSPIFDETNYDSQNESTQPE